MSVPARSSAPSSPASGAAARTQAARAEAAREAAARMTARRVAAGASAQHTDEAARPTSRGPRGGARAREPRGTARTRVLAPPSRPGSRLPAVLASGVVMLATLMAVLLLNIALSRGSYDDQRLTSEQTQLAEREQALREQLAAAQAPAALDARARALGMVPAGAPGYLRLSDGAVLGHPEPATSPSPPASPSASAAPSASASASASASPTSTDAASLPGPTAPGG